MQAILEDPRSGKVSSYQVPAPEPRQGGILVQTAFSAISTGTERAHRDQANKSLIGKAMARPDLVRQVIDFARAEGVKAAYERVQSRLDSLSPLGYSCAGVVIAAGEDAQEFQPGDRVACGGVGYASHCEVNFIPKNLAVRVPDSVPLDVASITTIGAIALQGIRQSQAVLGETVAVIGAGLVGVLAIQLAKAAGCRVIAIDLDPSRVEQSSAFGADLALCSSDSQTPLRAKKFARYGADAVIITAASPSSEPIELAAKIARDRGRIVVVGAVGLGVSRDLMYRKELSVSLSRSYGPGRYDPNYEEHGSDYPIGYVRWTEKRNMEAFLDLLAAGAIDVKPLLERRVPAVQAGTAYEQLKGGGIYTVLIEYPSTPVEQNPPVSKNIPQVVTRPIGHLRVGCIGAGAFARNVIFPALAKRQDVLLHAVATASGLGSESARGMFHFAHAMTPADVLQDAQTDALFVISRNASHAKFVTEALAHRKPVFVEKPLAISTEQLDDIRSAYEEERGRGMAPFLMVGFNRRFAPFTETVKRFFGDRQEPMVLNVRVNAGYIPREHWAQDPGEGGRIVGELCHFVDWVRAVVGVPIVSVTAHALPDAGHYNQDNVLATLIFRDGSIANLSYLANGDTAVPKEHFELFCEGSVASISDFRVLELTRAGKKQTTKAQRDKGHHREMELTVDAMLNGRQSPIPFEELLEVSEATLAITEAIRMGQSVRIEHSRVLFSREAELQQR